MKTVYVGNLSYSTTDDSLRSTFSAYGTVEEVNVMTDRQTGQPRGFAFVNMQDDESAEKAIAALDGTEMDGRRLTVSMARPKAPQADRRPFGAASGGRGGNRSGGFKRGGGGYGRY